MNDESRPEVQDAPEEPKASRSSFDLPGGDVGGSTPPESSGDATSDDKLWVLLTYVLSPVVPVIIMLMEDKKGRPFIKAHNMQALVAGVAAAVILIILGLIPVIQCITPIVGLAYWAVMIYWGIQGYNGKYITIPIVTDFVKNQGWA